MTSLSKVIFIHGVTKQDARFGFADAFTKEFFELPSFEFNWSEILNNWQSKIFNEYKEEKGMFTELTGLASIMTVSDAILYMNNRERIVNNLTQFIEASGKHSNLIFICHSMGTVLAIDYIMKNNIQNATIVSMGCNIGMFFSKPLTLPTMTEVIVVNEKNDLLGWSNVLTWGLPITTIPFKSANFFKGWNWMSHNTYWKNKKLAQLIKKEVL